MKSSVNKRAEKAKYQDSQSQETTDIVVKVVCRYRVELFFKISRKTKLSRLFDAWTERMEKDDGKKGVAPADGGSTGGAVKPDASSPPTTPGSTMQFVFTHNGRTLEADQTPEEARIKNGDEILAVELMDLTEGPASEEWVSATLLGRDGFFIPAVSQAELLEPRRQKLKKYWTENPRE